MESRRVRGSDWDRPLQSLCGGGARPAIAPVTDCPDRPPSGEGIEGDRMDAGCIELDLSAGPPFLKPLPQTQKDYALIAAH